MNTAPNTAHIQHEIKGQVLCLKINRPQVYNALNKTAKAEIQDMINWGNQKSDMFGLRAIVLGAEGKAFCTGQDLNDRASAEPQHQPADLGATLETEWNPLIKAIHDSKLPVIAAVQGVTAGAGISVALACDLIVAAPGVKFVSGFAKLGLCPDAGSTQILARALGTKRAFEFFIFNKPLLSEELAQAGLISQLTEDCWNHALSLAKEITALAPLAVQAIKHNLQQAHDVSWSDMLALEVETQRRLGRTQDYREGVQAFFDKRTPRFEGK